MRGVAILLVMFHHFWLFSGTVVSEGGMEPFASLLRLTTKALNSIAGSGWVGVDLFFVLSGFLITGILLDSKHQPRFFHTFYIRRVLRIFPLYFAFLALLFWLPQLVVPASPGAERQLADSAVWYWTYTINFLIAGSGWEAVPRGVGHLWSLAIEEQFYLIWPLVVFALSRRALKITCLGIVCGSLILRCVLLVAGISPTAVYVFTLTRMDPLAIGALVAIAVREPGAFRVPWRKALPLLTGALLVLGWSAARDLTLSSESRLMLTFGLSALGISFGVLIGTTVGSGAARDRLVGWLGASPLRFFGRYSYALYVLHQPVIFGLVWLGLGPEILPQAFGSSLPGKLFVVAVATAASVSVSLLSWHLLERRFLALKDRFTYSKPAEEVLTPGLAGSGVTVR